MPTAYATTTVATSSRDGSQAAAPSVPFGQPPEPAYRPKPAPRKVPECPPVLLAGDFPAPELWEAPEIRPTPATEASPLPGTPANAHRAATSTPSSATPALPPSLQVWLQARDPYCIVVFWDAAAGDFDRFLDAQGGGCWRLRVTGGHLPDRRVLDDALSTSLDHRFVAVPDPGCAYFAEIGFRTADGSWISAARSAALSTPVAGPGFLPPTLPATHSEDVTPGPAIATDPADVSIPTPPSRRPEESRSRSRKDSEAPPAGFTSPSARDSADAADLLFALALEEGDTPEFPSSGEWIRRTRRTGLKSGSNAGRAGAHPDSTAWIAPGSEGSSEHRLQPEAPIPPPEFWFEINAELIVYGRTERDAKVTVGGRSIPLRPDGSFRFQFTLPDGEYEMPVVAVNARNDDGRAALLEFSRHTETSGTVGTHPQDPNLNPPPGAGQ